MFKKFFNVNNLNVILLEVFMKKFLSLSLVLIMAVASCFVLMGCTTETINVNVVKEAQTKANTLISTFYNKAENTTLPKASAENFYIEISSDFDTNVEVVTINGIGHTLTENIKYSVGNNNFVETPAWMKEDGKLYVAVPTLYVEAKSGVTSIMVGNKEFKVTVFENAGTLTMDSVTVVGTTAGATAEKTMENDRIVVKHTRTSGKSAVGWTLSVGKEKVPADKYVFTKKIMSNSSTVSYGVDVTVDSESKGYSQALYNYWLNGNISEPVNRTINYTIAIPGYGNINFDIQVTETVPAA